MALGAFLEILAGAPRGRMMIAGHRDARGTPFRSGKTLERCLGGVSVSWREASLSRRSSTSGEGSFCVKPRVYLALERKD